MGERRRTPSDHAQRGGERNWARTRDFGTDMSTSEIYTLPRGEARDKAQEWFQRFPKAAYMTEVEFWRELSDGRIEFTIRRLPSAD